MCVSSTDTADSFGIGVVQAYLGTYLVSVPNILWSTQLSAEWCVWARTENRQTYKECRSKCVIAGGGLCGTSRGLLGAVLTYVLSVEIPLYDRHLSEREAPLEHASADFSFQRWARRACKTWIGTLMLAFNILSSLTEHASDLIAWLTLLSTSIYLLNIPSHRPRKPDSSTSNIYLAISDCNHSFQPKTIVSSHV